jgi:hypothetical protein
MLDEPPLTIAREHERSARSNLEQGCAADIASLDGVLAPSLALARRELQAALDQAGFSEAPLAERAVLYRTTEEIAARCIQRVRDRVNIRLRARLRCYAEAVWESESRLLARPRRVALPQLDLGSIPAPAPPRAASRRFVENWISELAARLRVALEREVAVGRRKVVRRVIASIARSRAARALRRSEPRCVSG